MQRKWRKFSQMSTFALYKNCAQCVISHKNEQHSLLLITANPHGDSTPVCHALHGQVTKKRMSANKAMQRFVFSRAPDLNSRNSLLADNQLAARLLKLLVK